MKINNQVKEFYKTYAFDKKIQFWKEKHNEFMDIWNKKIIPGKAEIEDFDRLVFIIDVNARNSTKDDEAVARTFIRYPLWYKCFQDLTEKGNIKKTLTEIFNSKDDEIIDNIEKLYTINLKNKNGLTTKSAIILNALLFLNKPEKYVTSLSMKHREIVCNKLAMNFNKNSEANSIIDSNRKIIDYFSKILSEEKLQINSFILPRFISDFIYSSAAAPIFWTNNSLTENDTLEQDNSFNQSFYLEKYLENFIYTNWEKIDKLGTEYEFILNEDDEPITLQYKTDIGFIDLLVKNKKNGDYLVIELKKDQTGDQTIGQITRYMGWVSENLANGDKNKVKGLIIAASYDDKIKQSLNFVNNVELMKYKVQFDLEYEKK